MIGDFYNWFWYHTEFWLTPVNRRPFTFIFRDWIYTHLAVFVALVALWFTGMVILSIWHGTATTITSVFTGMLLAHLVWGAGWIEGQQEMPEYFGGDDED